MFEIRKNVGFTRILQTKGKVETNQNWGRGGGGGGGGGGGEVRETMLDRSCWNSSSSLSRRSKAGKALDRQAEVEAEEGRGSGRVACSNRKY